jgi:predicted metalloendopeptidase
MNFGAIGSIIGHEITHAFDDFALKSKDWSKESRELYDKKVQCVVDHVSSYNVPEIEKYYKLEPGSYKLRGEQTKKEDIADL